MLKQTDRRRHHLCVRKVLLRVLPVSLAVPAAAWIYPEHRDIAILAVDQLDPDRALVFSQLWREARRNFEHRLCSDGADSAQGLTPDCIDWAALPAIAGDRACSSQQMLDNVRWIREAGRNQMVVGSQARILYADRQGRIDIALAFNRAVADGTVTGPVVLGRDHHDVSGTDSPYRETANIRDGSMFCADMAVQNFVGDAFRGATWVSLHNGGGVGWGEVINGGFGMGLDGTDDAARRARAMLSWDVSNGLARRAWAGNDGAIYAAGRAMEAEPGMDVTLPADADETLVAEAVKKAFASGS